MLLSLIPTDNAAGNSPCAHDCALGRAWRGSRVISARGSGERPARILAAQSRGQRLQAHLSGRRQHLATLPLLSPMPVGVLSKATLSLGLMIVVAIPLYCSTMPYFVNLLNNFAVCRNLLCTAHAQIGRGNLSINGWWNWHHARVGTDGTSCNRFEATCLQGKT